MKLSLAIATGRVLLVPRRGFLLSPSGNEGCALGMAMKAVGVHVSRPKCVDEPINVWPWLVHSLEWPCGCCAGRLSYAQAVTHIFDDHVMGRDSDWTLDRLIDQVRAWEQQFEPSEPPLPPKETTQAEEFCHTPCFRR